jgi:uncharacterized protein
MTIDVDRILRQTAHRPDPLPDGPWVLAQDWNDLLFAHWPVEASALRRLVPPALEIDLYDGAAWVAVTPFEMSGVRPRFVPPLPFVSQFLEVNCRTYVRHGGRRGIWFFSLDCTSLAVVALAGSAWHLPYFAAEIEMQRTGDRIEYLCRRRADAGPSALLAVSYGPDGPRREPAPDTFEHWAVERYCLFSEDGPSGSLWRGDIHHEPWVLQPAVARIEENTLPAAAGISVPRSEPRLAFARRAEVLTWLPVKVGESGRLVASR